MLTNNHSFYVTRTVKDVDHTCMYSCMYVCMYTTFNIHIIVVCIFIDYEIHKDIIHQDEINEI